MSFDFSRIGASMGQSVNAKEAELSNFAQTMDTGNSKDMVKMQQLTQEWSMGVSLQSTTMKLISDTLKGILQKIG